MRTVDPLVEWKGAFGDRYVGRNGCEAWKIANGVAAFGRILNGISPGSILEVGCNIGLNLLALRRLYAGDVALYGVEPNETAFSTLVSHRDLRLAGAWNCDGYEIPAGDGSVDLVFTAGVLIHVPPDRLAEVTSEIVRVSRRHVLCIEYFAHQPEEIPYHGQNGLLFKRDFGAFYLDHHSSLAPVANGFLWQREFANFDNLNWWLFEKAR